MTTITTIKFGFRKFIGLWAAFLIMLVTGISVGLGVDTVSGSIDLFAGLDTLITLFGGLVSFWAIIVFAACAIGIVTGIIKIGRSNFDNRSKLLYTISVGVFALFVIAMKIGMSWVTMPSGFGWWALALLGLPAIPAFFGARSKSTSVKPVDPTIATRRRLKKTERTSAPSTNDAGFPVAEPDNTSITI